MATYQTGAHVRIRRYPMDDARVGQVGRVVQSENRGAAGQWLQVQFDDGKVLNLSPDMVEEADGSTG